MNEPDTNHHAADSPDAPGEVFNPFCLLDVDRLDGATLDRYAVFLIGLRKTLRGAVAGGGTQDAMLREFLGEVEEALLNALAARHRAK